MPIKLLGMIGDNDPNDLQWMTGAEESTLTPDIVFGFDFDFSADAESKDKYALSRSLIGGISPTLCDGFSNEYARYINLEGMFGNLDDFTNSLARVEEIKQENKLTRLIFWWTPAIYVEERDLFFDFSSMRSLQACESFLRALTETSKDGEIVEGIRSDYNNGHYQESWYLHLFQGRLYYRELWERGHVLDDSFDPEFLEELGTEQSYFDPNFEAFQEKAQSALKQLITLKEAMVKTLGPDAMTKQYYLF